MRASQELRWKQRVKENEERRRLDSYMPMGGLMGAHNGIWQRALTSLCALAWQEV
jgi:hypothetical protein